MVTASPNHPTLSRHSTTNVQHPPQCYMDGSSNAWIWFAVAYSNFVVGIWLAVSSDGPTRLPNNQPSDSNNDHLSNAYARHPPLYHTGGCPNAWIWSAVAYSNFVVGIRLVLSGDSSPKPPRIQPSDSNNNHCSATNTRHPPLYHTVGCPNAWIWSAVTNSSYIVGIGLDVVSDSRTKPSNIQPSESMSDLSSTANTWHPPLY